MEKSIAYRNEYVALELMVILVELIETTKKFYHFLKSKYGIAPIYILIYTISIYSNSFAIPPCLSSILYRF